MLSESSGVDNPPVGVEAFLLRECGECGEPKRVWEEGGAEERRSGGAEERRSGGAGEEERTDNFWIQRSRNPTQNFVHPGGSVGRKERETESLSQVWEKSFPPHRVLNLQLTLCKWLEIPKIGKNSLFILLQRNFA
ncbi:MAG: hypothetical protein F6K41_43575 [Symploca sp. SIO3E6]|nr:hypothetical protein [Caldora sp. SIO3E6]